MSKHADQRDRTLYLARILLEETDEKHPLPMSALKARLAHRGVSAERKSIYRDLAALRRHGVSVAYRAGTGGGWYLEERTFDRNELRAIVDAVSVYRWMPETTRTAILEKITGLAPAYQRAGLRRPVTVRRRSAAAPEDVQAVLDRLHTACQTHRAVSFLPFTYDRDKSKAAVGPRYVISPKGLLWADEGYALLAWDHQTKALDLFRPDRMVQVLVTGMPAQGPEVDLRRWAAAPFGLEPSRQERVRLRCGQAMVGDVLDKFGAETPLFPEGEDRVTFAADVVVGPSFWGWMAAHGDQVEVVSPAWAAKLWTEQYKPRTERSALPTKAV